MNKRKILGTGSIIVAVVLSVVSVTIAFAALNSDLKINGSAKVKGSHWSIIFTDLEEAVKGNEKGITSTADIITNPTINGETSIGTYKVQLKTPGDFVSYNFKINNTGDFNAVIDTFTMPEPNCTKGTRGKDTDATSVCDNLEYTLKYVTEGSDGQPVYTDVKTGDTLAVGEKKLVQLRLYYKKEAVLPFDDVEIDNLNITIPFKQVE